MTKPTRLTDDELGDLLRETFAEHETLTDHLPEASKRRSHGPVLLAAAAVLVVLVGVLYGVNRPGHSDPPPTATPAATPAVSEDGRIWAVAVVSIARLAEPSDGWQVVQVFGQGQRAHTQVLKASPAPVVTFSAAAKARIEEAVRPLAPVAWGGGVDESCTARRVATVTVGPVASKADHKEVPTSIFYDCGRGSILTYRIEKVDGSWKVTGTVGGVTGVLPVGGCPSASPREGC
ncbi:hypothetical protein [Kribbella soli]|uniref:Uncharacterized protein n=1 Tax=Kribbella soli TaxID=1124743 RepID=A0A4R0HL73_9ACTN|nr:hypothetical protein [Kribbella soli]TCC12217.1 hypothetical protein E0H45_13665 [Kribbella soli]